MINKFTAEKAAKISEQNELPMLIKKIDNVAHKGFKSVFHSSGISEKTKTELKELGFDIAKDEEQGFYTISW